MFVPHSSRLYSHLTAIPGITDVAAVMHFFGSELVNRSLAPPRNESPTGTPGLDSTTVPLLVTLLSQSHTDLQKGVRA